MIKYCKSLDKIGVPSDEDMALINQHSLKELNKDEVFCFSIILCDNDIDRDFERFSENALVTLKRLFVGKTGILNHSMKSEDQACRTYKTRLIYDKDRLTADNEPYICLKAWCYTVRSEKNLGLIADIESGIKKEVSISCASDSRICSICGKSHCNHLPGRKYNGMVCHKTIDNITDAYEWSFVAVPAQRNAGVTKTFKKENSMENILKSIKEDEAITLCREQLDKLSSYMDELNKKSADGEKYRSNLTMRAKKSLALLIPTLKDDCVSRVLKNLGSDTLEELCSCLDNQVNTIIPPAGQLFNEKSKKDSVTNEFKF